jgi:hypothetical protein
MEKKKCPVCNTLGEICKEVGEERFCDELFEMLDKNEINVEEFTARLLKNRKIAETLEVKT